MRIPIEEPPEAASLINLTPLIDVVFLLLIFFMVTATFQNDERDLKIAVPKARHGDPIKELPRTLLVGVRKDGSFRVGEHTLDQPGLRRVLERACRKNHKQKVILRADRAVPFRYPVIVLDLCRGLHIQTAVATTAMTSN